MIEIEFKFEVDKKEIDKVLKKLKMTGYLFGKKVYEKTVMYDNPAQIMQVTDGRVRIRQTGRSTEFSYKKPLTRKGIKREIEHEVTVSDFDTTQKILEMLEFRPVSSYERYRTTILSPQKDIKVTVDEFPFANYLEIEGDEKKIRKLVRILGFSLNKNITKSCDSLFQEWRSSRGLPFRPHLLFSDFNK